MSRDGCPFQVNNLCTARETRPLGCRIYFCDPAYQGRMAEITEEAVAALKRIADAHDTGWEYAPLHHFLNAAGTAARGYHDRDADATNRLLWRAKPCRTHPQSYPALLTEAGQAETIRTSVAGLVRPVRHTRDQPRAELHQRGCVMSRFLAALFLTLALTLSLKAGDWPQFLGPNRDNTTPDVVEPWKGDLKRLWKQPVGDAHSSPVVAGGLVYAFYQPKGKNADALAAFDAKTGELKWEKSYDRPEYKPPFGNGPRSTPAISGGKVFTYSGLGILACWDAKTGELDWKVEPLKEFKTANPFFGTSTSPIVAGDKVVVMVGGKGSGVVAFNVKDGKAAWQALDDPASYSSPIWSHNQLVFLTGANLVGLSEKGEKLWSVPFEGARRQGARSRSSNRAATPIIAGDVVIGSTVSSGSVGLKLTEKDGKYAAKEEWRNRALTCYFSTPVVVGENVYMVKGSTKQGQTVLTCIDPKTGKVAWDKPTQGEFHTALLRCGPAGKEKMLMLDDGGELTLFEPDAKEFKPLAKSKVCGKTWAHPALADGRIYLRDEKELICVELKK